MLWRATPVLSSGEKPWISSVVTTKMPKEKNYNPVQAQRKAEKAKAIKKGTVFPFHYTSSLSNLRNRQSRCYSQAQRAPGKAQPRAYTEANRRTESHNYWWRKA